MSLVFPRQIFDALEPNQIHHTRSIGKMSDQTPLAAFSYRFKTQNLPFQLDIGHVSVYFMDIIKTATVYIFIGEIIQQIMQGKDIQLLVQHCRPLGADTLQILYVTRS